jgi:hypothetical protein
MDLKTALLSYYRYKHQHVCADEVGLSIGNADILVDTGNLLIEVEVKISRSDMFQGEKRKGDKHNLMLNPVDEVLKKYIIPNQFYVAVPTELLPSAHEWVNKINPNYGIIECKTKIMALERPNQRDFLSMVRIEKRAKALHEQPISKRASEMIGRRLSSAMTAHYQVLILEQKKRIKEYNNGKTQG